MPARALIDRDVEVVASDGTILRADVWRPAGAQRHPALLQRLPYDKSDSFLSAVMAGLEPLRAVESGFAVVIQDTRGRFASDGEFRAFVHEGRDGADTVEWVAAQPWCDGRVCMYGSSYVGATQLLAAARRPAGLAAIAPSMTSSDFYEGWTYRGGALQWGFVLLWALSSLAVPTLARWQGEEGRASEMRSDLLRMLGDIDRAYWKKDLVSLAPLNELVPDLGDWLSHTVKDDYWRSVAAEVDAIAVPGLHVAGWNDIFLDSTLSTYATLKAAGRAPQCLVVGPWAHGNMTDFVGEVNYGPSASSAAIDLTEVHLAWFNAVLAGRADDVPPVRVFVMGSNTWREEQEWPPARVAVADLYLRSGTAAGDSVTGGRLTTSRPESDESPDWYEYDPRHPTPTCGGATYLPGVLVSHNAGPKSVDELEGRSDVVIYTSERLEHNLELAGRVTATLYAATTAPDADWAVRVAVLDPHGHGLGLVDGIFRASAGDSARVCPPALGHEVRRYEIELGSTCTVIPAGDRLRVIVSSANFPRFDINPNAGRQVIFHDHARASVIRLPLSEGRLV